MAQRKVADATKHTKEALESLKIANRFTPGRIRLGKWTIHYNDSLALYNEYQDIFRREIYAFDPGHASPCIFDLGGYIGLSVLYFKHKFPNAHITVFEPDPTIFKLMEANIAVNHLSGIKRFNAAVGKEEGKSHFFPNCSDGGSIIEGESGTAIPVDMVKLSGFIKEPIDLLKMNIEGTEGDVLAEIESKLHWIEHIICEYHAFFNLPQRLGDILTILDRNNFRYAVSEVPCAPVSLPFRMTNHYKSFNLIYARKNNR